jgi:hypothetical protein
MAGNAYGGPPVGAVGRLVTPFSLGNGTTFAGLPTTASKWFAKHVRGDRFCLLAAMLWAIPGKASASVSPSPLPRLVIGGLLYTSVAKKPGGPTTVPANCANVLGMRSTGEA